ncbi:uncharacterized protein LOC119871144 isoform X1 [Canis lupus familiaris]|uniref:uncharacterized protein LOC119871144 isoform X1 n=1 Tax=Canis lupus familiaris TaxID=9615 RepID=UPI0018F7633B|nr:uncharacterized protein LOC119871144 isoform X1 [Canis lupus familiaris]XP_038513819.1 uncharacterized protein LOC119871144 isoform X1 [Canis lupus familiaris]
MLYASFDGLVSRARELRLRSLRPRLSEGRSVTSSKSGTPMRTRARGTSRSNNSPPDEGGGLYFTQSPWPRRAPTEVLRALLCPHRSTVSLRAVVSTGHKRGFGESSEQPARGQAGQRGTSSLHLPSWGPSSGRPPGSGRRGAALRCTLEETRQKGESAGSAPLCRRASPGRAGIQPSTCCHRHKSHKRDRTEPALEPNVQIASPLSSPQPDPKIATSELCPRLKPNGAAPGPERADESDAAAAEALLFPRARLGTSGAVLGTSGTVLGTSGALWTPASAAD